MIKYNHNRIAYPLPGRSAMLDLLFPFTDSLLDTNESDMFPFLVKMVKEDFDVVERSGMDRAKNLPEGATLKTGITRGREIK
jgi:hypothetical protein